MTSENTKQADGITPTGCWTESDGSFHVHDKGLEIALCELLRGQSVIDLGCGSGMYVNAMRKRGILACGVDGNAAGIKHDWCNTFDLTEGFKLDHPRDWVMCLEVAEHIPAEFEHVLLANIDQNNSKGVLISWATPGQVGRGHINERTPEYVGDKFREMGYVELDTTALRERCVAEWYQRNLRCFVKPEGEGGESGVTRIWMQSRLNRLRRAVFLACPGRGGIHPAAAAAFYSTTTSREHVMRWHRGGTLLANNFNHAYAQALRLADEGKITHFAMLHDDNSPGPNWLDDLIDVMEDHNADVVSAVVPIKDGRGLTSTAVADPDYDWEPLKRVTMAELAELPDVFGVADLGYPNNALLVNTGCWVADLRNPLFRMTDEQGQLLAHFNVADRIVKKEGQYLVDVESEDWKYSRQLHKLGAKVLATKRVRMGHIGETEFANDHVWGAWLIDQQGTLAKRLEAEYLAKKAAVTEPEQEQSQTEHETAGV